MIAPMTLVITTLRQRPEHLAPDGALAGAWPRFMTEDPISDLYYADLHRWADYALVATDDGAVVARAHSIPFQIVEDLPDAGWDSVVLSGTRPGDADRPDCTALEVAIKPTRRGEGLSRIMLEALRDNAFRMGHDCLYAPVRPSAKHVEPLTPMADYAWRTRPDGLPADPWLRVHVRAGGSIVKVAPTSMTIPGTLGQWRALRMNWLLVWTRRARQATLAMRAGLLPVMHHGLAGACAYGRRRHGLAWA